MALPKKLIVAGSYETNETHSVKFPFVALIDVGNLIKNQFTTKDFTMIKCFGPLEVKKPARGSQMISQKVAITALNYGPYDNGHIIVGLSNGSILILNSLDLSSMFRLQAFEPSTVKGFSGQKQPLPITKILFDPTQMIVAASLF